MASCRAAIGFHFGEQWRVVSGSVTCNAGVVLGRGANHGRTADVDVLDGVFQRHASLGDGRGEGVEVHADQIDGRDAVRCYGRQVFWQVATGQDAAVYLRMQRLDAAVEHFREAGVVADFGDGQAGVTQHLGSAPVDSRLTPERRGPERIRDAPLVGDGNQRCLMVRVVVSY